MKIYLVGGAVRDELLHRKVTERDWVVVGATAEQLLSKGYTQVGKDFPVFLHPETREEYALARTERKTGSGYTGFVCVANSDVTLEEDLLRRDLTINAMAKDSRGKIIDPYHGLADLEKKRLRHVSAAFSEDPLRVFRVARFAARYAYLGFKVADDTLALMKSMAASGELQSLSAERVWLETRRSLMEKSPAIYFHVLQQCGALSHWFPELAEFGDDKYQPLILAANSKASNEERFAALALGLSQSEATALCQRLKAPNSYRELALLSASFSSLLTHTKSPDALLEILDKADAWRKPERFQALLKVASFQAITATADEENITKKRKAFERALSRAANIDVQEIIASGKHGKAIRDALRSQRLELLRSTMKN
ncbi:CCA tRNA nucleotidyltransferase [Alteromonas pelagimontana]|uniref:CCA-adding enzyme n=1 Tax=Alteromonas pelagimontana TaxID=1858656 RepID=A0A6M4MGF9_9ALTE|nr:CCA tRNA nucleotidyltransferase [Alteromonas pelagimontana]QJR81720.1 CCA tRNA nucleotidyltransferase [Alteromonas pelagimontana]